MAYARGVDHILARTIDGLETRSDDIADGMLTVMLPDFEVKQRVSNGQISIAAGADESDVFPHPLEGQDQPQ